MTENEINGGDVYSLIFLSDPKGNKEENNLYLPSPKATAVSQQKERPLLLST